MAEPLTKKINDLPEMDVVAASNDKLLMLDVSESAVNMTKLVPMNLLSIHTSSQLAANVVGGAQIKDGAVTNSKLGADAVETAKIKNLNVTTGKLADNAVTEAKLGTIKRTLFLRVTAPDDTLTVGSTTNFFPFPISLNNFIVVDARINLVAASSSGTVTVALLNQGGTMTTLSLAAGATGMSASGTISTSYRTAKTNNFLGVNVTAAGTGAKGLSITLVLQGVPA